MPAKFFHYLQCQSFTVYCKWPLNKSDSTLDCPDRWHLTVSSATGTDDSIRSSGM